MMTDHELMTPAARAATLHCFLILDNYDNLAALRAAANRLDHLAICSILISKDAPLNTVEQNLQQEAIALAQLVQAVESGSQEVLCILLRNSRTPTAVARAQTIMASLGAMHDTYLATGVICEDELLREGCYRYEVAAHSLRIVADAVRTASKALKELDE